MANITLGKNQRIIANQAQKHGIHIIPVPAPGTSQTCPRCGCQHRENRKSQASFRCRLCGWQGNADHSAPMIIRNRGFVRTREHIHTITESRRPTGAETTRRRRTKGNEAGEKMSNNQNTRELSSRCITAGAMASAGAVLGTAGIITGIVLLFIHHSTVMQSIAMGITFFLLAAAYAAGAAGIIAGISWYYAGAPIARLCQRRQDETARPGPPASRTWKILAGTGLVIYAATSFTAAGLAANRLLATGLDPTLITGLAASVLGAAAGIPLGVSIAGRIIAEENRK